MQQATRPIGNPEPNAGNVFAPPPASPRFVVNLCASTTPVGLAQPTHAGLKRFTFFVSRRLEEGRERFRLHMGYFESQQEAEKILDLVRDVYPAAWAGVAPGIKLRARAAQGTAASPAAAAPEAAAPEVVAPQPATAVAGLRLELAPDLPRARPANAAAIDTATTGAVIGDAARSLVDVRAAIDSLGDGAAPAGGALLEGAAVLQLLTSARPAPAARVAPVMSVAKSAASVPEAPAPEVPAPEASRPEAPASRPLARAAGKAAAVVPQAAPRIEPALFAVQLLWSVQAIDMTQVSQLAIFSAYTLYGAEGNRDGRRWYGLRLGFFTDAVSAKQVAQYVRAEFNSVSVVPVTERERNRASAATARPLPPPAQETPAGPELNFIDEVPTDTAASGSQSAVSMPESPGAASEAAPKDSPAAKAAAAAVGLTSRAIPGKRAKQRVAQGTKPVSKRPRALSLEETLEILGAGDLQIDNGRGELMNDASLRDRKQPPPSNSRFGRLINRLAERLGNS